MKRLHKFKVKAVCAGAFTAYVIVDSLARRTTHGPAAAYGVQLHIMRWMTKYVTQAEFEEFLS